MSKNEIFFIFFIFFLHIATNLNKNTTSTPITRLLLAPAPLDAAARDLLRGCAGAFGSTIARPTLHGTQEISALDLQIVMITPHHGSQVDPDVRHERLEDTKLLLVLYKGSHGGRG
jgi:hypothetical protein